MAQTETGIPLTLGLPTDLSETAKTDLSSSEKREYKARQEQMIVIPHVDRDNICTGTFEVHRPGKDPYILNPWELDDSPTMTMCGDMKYRNPTGGCKHQRRIEALLEEGLVPEEGEDATECLEALAKTHQQLVEEREALIERQGEIRRKIAIKKASDGEDETAELEDELSDVVERTGDVEAMIETLEEAPAVET